MDKNISEKTFKYFKMKLENCITISDLYIQLYYHNRLFSNWNTVDFGMFPGNFLGNSLCFPVFLFFFVFFTIFCTAYFWQQLKNLGILGRFNLISATIYFCAFCVLPADAMAHASLRSTRFYGTFLVHLEHCQNIAML